MTVLEIAARSPPQLSCTWRCVGSDQNASEVIIVIRSRISTTAPDLSRLCQNGTDGGITFLDPAGAGGLQKWLKAGGLEEG